MLELLSFFKCNWIRKIKHSLPKYVIIQMLFETEFIYGLKCIVSTKLKKYSNYSTKNTLKYFTYTNNI